MKLDCVFFSSCKEKMCSKIMKKMVVKLTSYGENSLKKLV